MEQETVAEKVEHNQQVAQLDQTVDTQTEQREHIYRVDVLTIIAALAAADIMVAVEAQEYLVLLYSAVAVALLIQRTLTLH